MKIGPCEFPEPILAALREKRLVVFAGAGVSMGAPANLDNFADLADKIAAGTGEVRSNDEREDSFLGRLKCRGVAVHALAARELSKSTAPTTLHRDLLRLYLGAEQVRIVTTNYDQLFEGSAPDVFAGAVPEVFRAPALPLGASFSGIVHVHGDLTRPDEIVLTDADFGRGYLVEGWARRFLVELFRHCTVLFVGYKHNDLIVNYLARALPESQAGQRFALAEADDDVLRWRNLGIEPIDYPQTSSADHVALYLAVGCLADWVRRSISERQREVSALAEKPPPLSDEGAAVIDDALKSASTTRFFANTARLPEWIDWLDQRGYLAGLFTDAGWLNEIDETLALWLAKHFAVPFPGEVFVLIDRHKTRLHPEFWSALGYELTSDEGGPIPRTTWSRWISVLLPTAPKEVDSHVLFCLGQRCIKQDAMADLLLIFDHMLRVGSELASHCGEEHYRMSELWKNGLRARLATVAEPLLMRLIPFLENQYAALCVWPRAGSGSDGSSLLRFAIESNEHDGRYPEMIDIVIDAARDSLEWLAANRPVVAAGWCDQLVRSDAPKFHRLAVHVLTLRSDLSADEKLDWLLARSGVREPDSDPETLIAACAIYPTAGQNRREALVDAVRAYRWPDHEDADRKWLTAQDQFEWLSALHNADKNCGLATQALDDLLVKYPKLKQYQATDPGEIFGSISEGTRSPWEAEELLARPAADWLQQLLVFEGKTSTGPDRYGLLRTVGQAAKSGFDWGVGLAQALVKAGEWDTDLWSPLVWTWSETELDEREYCAVLNVIGQSELQRKYARAVANILLALVKNEGRPYASRLLLQANEIAMELWRRIGRDENRPKSDAWLHEARKNPAGTLASFWVYSLIRWRSAQEVRPTKLGKEYRLALSAIVDDPTLPGLLGRAVLASELALFLRVDETWTRECLLPLFAAQDQHELQGVWDGFLTPSRIKPAVAQFMEASFLKAVERVESDLAPQRRRFVEYYAWMVVYCVGNPLAEWVPCFFRHSKPATRRGFAADLRRRFRDLDDRQQLELWRRWLKKYWENRLYGVPAPLETGEIEEMVEWSAHLPAVFSEAVSLAVRMPQTSLQRGSSIDAIEKSDLPAKHPEAVARLLLYLVGSGLPGHLGRRVAALANRVLLAGLPPDLERELRDLLVTHGLSLT